MILVEGSRFPRVTYALAASLPSGDPYGSGPGVPSGFIALFVLVALFGIGTAIYKVWWAGELARRRGDDPGEARVTSFLAGDAGTAAAYVGRVDAGSPTSQPSDERTVAERLDELAELRRRGLVTPVEFAEKRAEILRDL